MIKYDIDMNSASKSLNEMNEMVKKIFKGLKYHYIPKLTSEGCMIIEVPVDEERVFIVEK